MPTTTAAAATTPPPSKENQKIFHVNLGEEALGGFAAGIVGTVLGFPLDLIKTRMQTSSSSASGGGRGMFAMLSHIVRTEGVRSVYKGIGPPLISLSIVNTMAFTSYSYFRTEHFHGQNGWDYRNALAGMAGAPLFGLITTPENFLKTQMQMDNVHTSATDNNNKKSSSNNNHKGKQQLHRPRSRFQSSWQCASALCQEHGIRVLYTGHVVNTVREGAFVACYFYIYEGFRQMLLDRCFSNNASLAVPLAGGLAGASAWFFSFPLDCIRAGVQGHDLTTKTTRPGRGGGGGGAIQVFWQLLQTRGMLGLYAGVGPSIARAFLVSGSRFSAYEGALYLCRGGRDYNI